MSTQFHRFAATVVCCATLLSGVASYAQEGQQGQQGRQGQVDQNKIMVSKTYRMTKLKGLNVRNKAGEKLGTVEDFVIDVPSGKVAYLALGVGGALGIGEKLYAVPYQDVKFNYGRDEQFFVLDISKEKLDAAPGFDKNNWPDFADPQFTQRIDEYYRQARTNEARDRATPSNEPASPIRK